MPTGVGPGLGLTVLDIRTAPEYYALISLPLLTRIFYNVSHSQRKSSFPTLA